MGVLSRAKPIDTQSNRLPRCVYRLEAVISRRMRPRAEQWMRHGVYQEARILVVDDQSSNILLLELILKQAGYAHIRGVTDSSEAVATFDEFKPDVVLLDLMMPAPDGIEVLARL